MSDKPPFIDDQGMQILTDFEHPQRHLRAEDFRSQRAGRGGRSPEPDSGGDAWVKVENRLDVALDTLRVNGEPCSLHRLVVTTDAGTGKSVTMRWLDYLLNCHGGQSAAFLIDLNRPNLRADADKLLSGVLPRILRQANENDSTRVSDDQLVKLLTRLRDQGRIALLFDALDQTSGDGRAAELLADLLLNQRWSACRIVVAGRPHAIVRHWEKLFGKPDTCWRFIKLAEFDERQQRRFLGKTKDGRERLDLLPEEAREILGVPRVLEYLRALADVDLDSIRTPSDVYWRAVGRMLAEGLKADRARMLGLPVGEPLPREVQPQSIACALKLLAAMAFEMTSQRVRRQRDGQSEEVPNFDRVPPGAAFGRFAERVFERLKSDYEHGGYQLFQRDLTCLFAMNEVLGHGFLDSGLLRQVLWRNRSLQEFFAAVSMAGYCTDDDSNKLWDWLYLPQFPQSEEYYWVWRYAVEMPAPARNPAAWVRAMSPLYRPGDGTPAGTRRSNEMVWRSWKTMQKYVEDGESEAARILGEWHNDFEKLVFSRYPIALQLLSEDDLVRRQIITPDDAEARHPRERTFAQCPPHADVLPVTNASRESFDPDPPEKDGHDVRFLMQATAVTREQFALYDLGYEAAAKEMLQTYAPEATCPAVMLSWYDAICFARWVGARLPTEGEWQFAARAGASAGYCRIHDPSSMNGYRDLDTSTELSRVATFGEIRAVPVRGHGVVPNFWWLWQLLGNTWEWCEDPYEKNSSGRVVRSAAFDDGATGCWARRAGDPAHRSPRRGFRLCRDMGNGQGRNFGGRLGQWNRPIVLACF